MSGTWGRCNAYLSSPHSPIIVESIRHGLRRSPGLPLINQAATQRVEGRRFCLAELLIVFNWVRAQCPQIRCSQGAPRDNAAHSPG
jgi:hypothetical protein